MPEYPKNWKGAELPGWKVLPMPERIRKAEEIVASFTAEEPQPGFNAEAEDLIHKVLDDKNELQLIIEDLLGDTSRS